MSDVTAVRRASLGTLSEGTAPMGGDCERSVVMNLHSDRRDDDEDLTRSDVFSDSWTNPGGASTAGGVPGAETGRGSSKDAADRDSDGRDEVIRDLREFVSRLGLRESARVSKEQIAQLFEASAGRLSLARTVVEVLRDAPLPTEMSLRSFADYIATLTPTPNLGLAEGDIRFATMLSHLSAFTKQTALFAIASVPSVTADGGGSKDAENILMRLRMSGVVVSAGEIDDRQHLQIPGLLAAKLRHDFEDADGHGEAIEQLSAALLDQLENSQSTDPALLADALILARQARLWSTLVRAQEAFGLSTFLLVPQASCTAFGSLPAEALDAEPTLNFFAMIAEGLRDRLEDGIDEKRVRDALVAATHPGQLWKHFPGPASAKVESELDGPPPVQGERAGYFAVLRRIVDLSGEGRHPEAAALGLDWSARPAGRRAHLVIRFITAVSLFHASDPRRALSILHEIETPARDNHIDGDFLLPAIMAWSALVAVHCGDHDTADDYLTQLTDGPWFPLILDELVHPAQHIAAAKRALDRLDLDLAREEFRALADYPENRSLWVFLPVIGRMIAVLSAATESGLLFANDDVEKHRGGPETSATGADLLSASRGMVFIGLGRLKLAELELARMSSLSDERIVLSVRIELVAGRYESAISLADTWFYNEVLTPLRRAELAAIKAAALLRVGRVSDAVAEFGTAVGLCPWVGSLLPLAFLPQQDRIDLIDLTTSSAAWDEINLAFAGFFRGREEFMDRLRSVGAISVHHASLPQLSAAETQLLDCLAEGLSIAQISRELHQVTGTVKNRLSALYRKFGVSNKAEVISRARSMGFIMPA